MAAKSFVGYPTIKNLPSVSSFPSKFILFRSKYNQKHGKMCDFGTNLMKKSGLRNLRLRPRVSLGGFLGGIFKGDDNGESTRQKYDGNVSLINGMEAEMLGLSDSELRERTVVLRERARKGESLDSLLPLLGVEVRG
ncbi:hypothetical protein GIB67_029848 [Kingdonia uniflora]|uniref:Uncharacterized protein n=1 Tax=Kingdonia uniflora TaxID=39325 RepID=A0A7J7NJN0_9MAGN|nr:hypothetical protein GIB67_029848 [Kingdonia uniflora]